VVPWPGVVHACCRGSRGASGAVATAYIALNDFMRRKHLEGGLPAGRIVVKPNFVEHDSGLGAGEGGFALFVARLNKEKGVGTLLEAWRRLGTRLPLRIMGDGPMTTEVAAAAREIPGLEFLGRRPLAEFYEQLGRARFFLFTSTWYEGFPRTIIEAYARGTPIIASAIGPIAEVVADGRTGVHFRPGDASDLVAKVEAVLGDEPRMAAMRAHARAEFEAKFTAEANLPQTLAIYERALAGTRRVTPGRTASRAEV
jgi:glycosyltransferase involved in cell wall biosynthesis